MPSSIIWIGLVVVWLVVLVPMLSSQRPEVKEAGQTGASERVVRRGLRNLRNTFTPRSITSHSAYELDEEETDWAETEDTIASGQMEQTLEQHVELDSEQDREEERVFAGARETFNSSKETDTTETSAMTSEASWDTEPDDLSQEYELQEYKYRVRQYTALGLLSACILFALCAVFVSSFLWIVSGVSAIALVGYLAYLRYQVRLDFYTQRHQSDMGYSELDEANIDSEAGYEPGYEGDYRSDSGPYGPYDEYVAEPYRQRFARSYYVESDDGDPAFMHLESYENDASQYYQRASG